METKKIYTRCDLATELTNNEYAGLSLSAATHAVNDTISSLTCAFMRGESVVFRGFGTFKVVQRKAKKARIINTGETIDVPATYTVKFVPSKQLKQALNNGKK